MEMDKPDTTVPGPGAPRRARRVKLRLVISCSQPSEQADAAWTEFLLRMLRRRAINE